MAPHAIQNASPALGTSFFEPDLGSDRDRIDSFGFESEASGSFPNRSLLQKCKSDELHDMICVGFGPASLAIAAALHDSLQEQQHHANNDFLAQPPPKVLFLEKQAHFAWHAGMLLPGAKMQITFVKDLATLRNPKSDFTFLNYLHEKGRLVEFTNLSTFLPQRIEFEDYLKWCAQWFENVTEYSQEVVEVAPKSTTNGSSVIDSFAVTSRNITTGELSTRHARHVVIAAGGKPSIPKHFPQSHPCIIHSSQYTHKVRDVLVDPSRRYRVAVVGSGQSAAEVFETLHAQYPNAEIQLLIKGTALRPSDDSPFVNELFNPSRVASTFDMPPARRAQAIAEDRNTNYGVVRLELLERIYESLYLQRIQYANEADWPLRILPHRWVSAVEAGAVKGRRPVVLIVQNTSDPHHSFEEQLDVDMLVMATGYSRLAHEELMSTARHLMPQGGQEVGSKWEVAKDYRVRFADGEVSADAGIWLQGCNQETHGLSDTLLSVLAVRGGEIVESIFGPSFVSGTL